LQLASMPPQSSRMLPATPRVVMSAPAAAAGARDASPKSLAPSDDEFAMRGVVAVCGFLAAVIAFTAGNRVVVGWRPAFTAGERTVFVSVVVAAAAAAVVSAYRVCMSRRASRLGAALAVGVAALLVAVVIEGVREPPQTTVAPGD
jgi:hypothetical protein